MSESLHDNHPRFRTRTDHVESWFFKANDPHRSRALWIKATVLCRKRGSQLAEVWCSVFDADRVRAFRASSPLEPSQFVAHDDSSVAISIHDHVWHLHRRGGALRGRFESPSDRLSWDLSFTRFDGPLGEPLCLFPTRRMIDATFPRNQLLTPFPVAQVAGELVWNQERIDLSTWIGMQGHNWGKAHPPEYAWGQTLFWDTRGVPFALCEGASGRIAIGGIATPLLSLLVVRRREIEYRFDRIIDIWHQHPKLQFPTWQLALRGNRARATLVMRGEPERMVCLGYDNPNAPRAWCHNSKTSSVTLRVEPDLDDAFECTSLHGGALEFLKPDADSRIGAIA